MSDEFDVVRGDSSTNTSTTGSFENVSASCVSVSSAAKLTNSDVTDDKSTDAEQNEAEATVENRASEQEQFYSPAHTRSAITNLVRFTAAMFVLPLLTMFTTYHYVFRDYFGLPPDQAMLYAGLCGIAVVIVIMVAFVYTAYREEQEDEQKKLSMKKSE